MKTSRNCPHGLPHTGSSQHDFVADTPVFSRMSTSHPLSNIEEESPMCLPLLMSSYDLPDTPQEPMEFLSRSWSISALEVAKALNPMDIVHRKYEDGKQHAVDESPLVSAPFSFASAATAQFVMERILSYSDISPLISRRNSYSSGPLSFMGPGPTVGSPPMSPRQADDLSTWLLVQQSSHPDISPILDCTHNNKHFCRSFSGMRAPLRAMSMKRWIKDIKERKKEAMRVHNAQVHAAMSVAGVAAAIAAIATSTATVSSDEVHNKTSMVVASAASLVAAQCVEIAESMGADHEQMSSIVRSAVSVRTPGDVVTLTAAAATALRAVATLKARTLKHHHSHATVIPYERGSSSIMNFNVGDQFVIENSEAEFGNHAFLRRGCEFLKRTSKGELHWRSVSVYINKHSQVVVKSQSKCMGITKSKKRNVREVVTNIPAWPGRDVPDGVDERRYFGIKTDHGVMELECKSKTEYRLWTEGISHLLSLVQHQQPL